MYIHGQPPSSSDPFTDLEEDSGEIGLYVGDQSLKYCSTLTVATMFGLRYLNISRGY